MPTIDPVFSILIPSLPERQEMLFKLMAKIRSQVADLPVEILSLIDNRCRSIGLKRQALLDVARGRFVAFVDDDDDVSDEYVSEIVARAMTRPEVDVIVFNQFCCMKGFESVVVRFGLEYENQEVKVPGGATRKPWQVCPWKREIAQRCVFPDASYGEDWWWAAQCNKLAKTQARIDKVLHTYRFDPGVTQAELVYPPKEIPEPLPARTRDG